ncbi:MAG: AIR synthase-related protein [Candidatus Anstonellales archaeon]
MYNPEKPYKDKIIKMIRQTWKSKYININQSLYPLFSKKFSYIEIDHTDGIGTKGIYHWEKRAFRNAVLDALAMNLNDLALERAKADKLQCHIIIPEDDVEAILSIMSNLVKECKKLGIAITGGETSIQNNINGLDISITVSGFIEDYKKNKFEIGDSIIGVKSSGLHSNGFTKIREALSKKDIEKHMDELVLPTRLYYSILIDVYKKFNINGAMHITGGAYTKLKALLPRNADAIINRDHSLKPQKIFAMLYKKGLTDEEMYKTFNCGIGYIISAKKEEAKKVVNFLRHSGFESDIIGTIEKGKNNIIIESMFSNEHVKF